MHNINYTAQNQALYNNINLSGLHKSLDFCLKDLPLDNCEVFDFEITSKEVDGKVCKGAIVHIRSTEKPLMCSKKNCCGKLHSHGSYPVDFRHLTLGDSPITIRFHKNRYKCSQCGHTISTEAPFQYCSSRITTSLANSICNAYVEQLSYTTKGVARNLHVSEYYANMVLERYCDANFRDGLSGIENADQCMYLPPEDQITEVLVDEISTKGRNYVTCFYNAKNLHLLFFVRKNNKAAIKSFIDWGGDKISPTLKVACDMNAPFVSAFKEALPSCEITLDRFHVMNNINVDFERAFLDLALHMSDSNKAKTLLLDKDKKAIFVLLSRKSHLDNDKKKLLKKLLKDDDVKTLYDSYQSIFKCYDKSKNVMQFRESLFKIMANLLWLEARSDAFRDYSKPADVFHDCYCGHYLTDFPDSNSDQGALNQQTDSSNFNTDALHNYNTNEHEQSMDDKVQSPVSSKEAVVPSSQSPDDITESQKLTMDDKVQSPVSSKEAVVPSSQSPDGITESQKPKKKKRNSSIVRVCRRLSSKLENIANFTSTKLTTGPIEGLNNRLKSVKRARYGIKYLSRFMDIIRILSLKGYSGSVKTKHA